MNLILKSRPFVILLGKTQITPIVINAINKDYDIIPYLYSTARPHHISGILRYKFFRLKYPENLYYIILTLKDFSKNNDNRYTAILIPMTKKYSNLVETNKEDLESSFIIRSPEFLINSLPTIASKKELHLESL